MDGGQEWADWCGSRKLFGKNLKTHVHTYTRVALLQMHMLLLLMFIQRKLVHKVPDMHRASAAEFVQEVWIKLPVKDLFTAGCPSDQKPGL